MNSAIWFDKPAADWLEGLPIGTGRLAAMVMGSYKRERVALNHEWLWTGKNRDRDNREAAHLLPEVRRLLLAGEYREGTLAGSDAFSCFAGDSSEVAGGRVDRFQPLGDLYIEVNYSPIEKYRRVLDFDRAGVEVRYGAKGKRFRREYIAHLSRDIILIRLSADGERFDSVAWLDRPHDAGCRLVRTGGADAVGLTGHIRDGLSFHTELAVWRTDGRTSLLDDGRLAFDEATEVILAVNAGTSAFVGDPLEEARSHRVDGADWTRLLEEHELEYTRRYGGFRLEVLADDDGAPTDERMRRRRSGEADDALPLLFFNYGRYLLAACSANGSLPANLQGKWCEDFEPVWQSDYHHDINLQMNYWPAEPAGMPSCVEALLAHIERFVPHAREAARDLYGCEGVVFPIQTDPWGRATSESWGHATWIGAAAWLAQHVWWHWEYGRDEEFLRTRAYPFLKEVAAFYESYLIEDEEGVLQVVPSQSPENSFIETGEKYTVSLGVSSAMDVQLVWESLTHAVRAAEILDVDADQRHRWCQILGKLPALRIGSDGALLEWNEEFKEVNPAHEHYSHLYGLYPGEQLDPEREPELARAAIRALEKRLEGGGATCGWSRAWAACLFARVGDGSRAFEQLDYLITHHTTDALLDLYPERIFQIDGNLGGCAVVVEMLFQSYYEELDFLPALPPCWPEGRVRGLRGRGGYTVDICWREGELDEAAVVSLTDRDCAIRCKCRRFEVRDASGKALETRIAEDGRLLQFPAAAGIRYTITLLN